MKHTALYERYRGFCIVLCDYVTSLLHFGGCGFGGLFRLVCVVVIDMLLFMLIIM